MNRATRKTIGDKPPSKPSANINTLHLLIIKQSLLIVPPIHLEDILTSNPNNLTMSCLALALIVTLATVASAEWNITLNADQTAFEISGPRSPMSRISNGAAARLDAYPWHATIFTIHQAQVWTYCSGALISDQFVVTQASWTKGSVETRVFLGSNAFGQGHQQFSNQLMVHPHYQRPGDSSDVALVRLNEPVLFNNAIRPVSLPPFQLFNAQFDGQFARVSGFGSSGKCFHI